MKGIILAGGSGTRLLPSTRSVCKQLIPVYDKPMIFYPLCTLMSAGIRDVLLVVNPGDIELFKALLGDGSDFGISVSYCVQSSPDGIAEALVLGESFLQGDCCALILGDNIFYGSALESDLLKAASRTNGGTVFGYRVADPCRYGVIEFDVTGRAVDIIEKPDVPVSNYVVTGLYFYDSLAPSIAKSIRKSPRGEYEITDVNRAYLEAEKLEVVRLGRGVAWLDMGTHGSLLEAANFIETLERRQGVKIACPEEVSWRKGWIGTDDLLSQASRYGSSSYGDYLLNLVETTGEVDWSC